MVNLCAIPAKTLPLVLYKSLGGWELTGFGVSAVPCVMSSEPRFVFVSPIALMSGLLLTET